MKSLKISLLAFAVACCGLSFGQSVVLPSLTTTVQNDISTTTHPNLFRVLDTNKVSLTVNAGDYADSLVLLQFDFYKDGMPIMSLPASGTVHMTMPVGGTDTTWNIVDAKSVIPSPSYTYKGNTSLIAVSLGVFTTRPITMDVVWFTPGRYTINWKLVSFNGAKTPYGSGYVSFDMTGTEGGTILEDSLVMNVEIPDFTFNLPAQATVNETFNCNLDINANSYVDRLGYLGYEVFRAPLNSTSYTNISSDMSTYMTMQVNAASSNNVVSFAGDMVNYNRLPGSSAISFGMMDSLTITTSDKFYTDGEYMFVFYTVNQVGSQNDTLRIDTLNLTVGAAVADLPSLTQTYTNPIDAGDSTIYRAYEANKVNLLVSNGDYGDSLVSLYYTIKKDDQIISDLSQYGKMSVKLPATAGLPLSTDTTYNITTSVDVIPGSTYGYPGYSMDGFSLNLFGGRNIELDIEWNVPGTYTLEWYLVKRVLTGASTVQTISSASIVNGSTMGDTLLNDTLVMNVIIPDFTYSFPSQIDTGAVTNANLDIVANSYANQNGYLGYQAYRAPKGTTTYSDITSSMATYMKIDVEASSGGTVQFSGDMADYNRLPGSSTISFGLLDSMTIATAVTAKADGEYMFVFYTVDQVSTTVTDTLRIDTIKFTVIAPDATLPTLTLVYTNPLDSADSTLYRAYDTNIVNLSIDNGGYGDSLVSLYYNIKKDGQVISDLSEYGAMSVKLPATAGLPLSTDTTYEITTATDVIPGSTYGYPGYPMDGFSLNLFGGRNIELDIQWKVPGNYTLEWLLVKRALGASSNVQTISQASIVNGSTMGDTILTDTLVMNVIIPDFTYPFPSLLDTENVVMTNLSITGNSYLDQNGYLGYQAFQAPLGTTSYTEITSNLANYLDMNVDATSGGSTIFSGNMANYNRIPGSSAISFRTLEDLIITSRVLAKAEGEYGFVFYTIDQVNSTTTDTLRIDSIFFTVKALELPVLDTIVNVDPVNDEDSTEYKLSDTNKINVGFNVGGYANTLGYLTFKVMKDGVPVTSIAKYGSLSFKMNKVASFPFTTDTVFDITTVTGDIPGTTYGYSGYPMDGVTLNLFNGQNITMNALWNEPGKYAIVMELHKRNLNIGSIVTNYTTDGAYASVRNSAAGRLLMSDTVFMEIVVPEMTYTVDSIMNTKETFTDSILINARSYRAQTGYYGYQVMYAPLFTSTYSDITSTFSTYGTIAVKGTAAGTTVYSENLTDNNRFPASATPTFGSLDSSSMNIVTTTNWTKPGYYTMYFYTIQPVTSGNDTLCIDTVSFIVGATYLKQYKDTICLGANYGKYGFDTTINTVGTHALLHTFKTVYGCDSNIAVSLTILPSYGPTQINASVCRGTVYNANGFLINTRDSVKGVYNYQQMLQTSKGCDSIINLQLVVNDTALKVVKATICLGERYNANGFNVLPTAAGEYKYTNFAYTSNGCDSTVDLYLTVNQTYKITYQDEICMGSRYTKYGFDTTVTVSTILVKNLNTVNGCDSIVSVALTVRTQTSRSIYDNICRSEGRYVKNGFNFPLPAGISSTVEQIVYQSTYGCDSTVTLYLTINDGDDTTINASLCEGERYASNGIDTTFYMAGTFNVQRVLNAANGCDSTVNFTFVVKPSYTTYETIELCGEDSALYNGVKYGAGTHTIIYPATTVRCDSTLYLTVNVSAITRDTITVSPCRGSQPSYYFGGKELTQDGYYEDTVAVGSCYTIHVLNLTFADTATRPLAIYGDTNIYTAGNYTYYVDTVPGATSYLWETTDITWTISANNETAVITIPTPGSGLIMVSSVNACGVSSKQSVQVFSAVPVHEAIGDDVDMNLFPNPAQNNVTLSVNGMEGNAQIRITDVSGKFIYSDNVEVSATGSNFNINIADFAKGVYMVSITSDKSTIVKKLVVK